MKPRARAPRPVAALLTALAAALSLAAVADARDPGPRPIVTVVRHGGLCLAGTPCRTVLRIDDATISGDGYRPRPLRPA